MQLNEQQFNLSAVLHYMHPLLAVPPKVSTQLTKLHYYISHRSDSKHKANEMYHIKYLSNGVHAVVNQDKDVTEMISVPTSSIIRDLGLMLYTYLLICYLL